MRARSFSHVGITVRNFNEFVRFYWDVFKCPLVGVSDTPSERVRAFFGVDAPPVSAEILETATEETALLQDVKSVFTARVDPRTRARVGASRGPAARLLAARRFHEPPRA